MSNRYRFPPSPTGHLHVGNVRTALYNWLLARQEGGEFILRIEDTDVERSTRESEEALLRDLEWLGIDWDEGPGAGGPFEPYRQSEREDTYRELAARLLEEGLAYYCFCSPDDLKAERERALKEGRPPRYSGKCRAIAPEEARRRVEAGEPAALRFRVEDGPAVEWEDLVHGHLSVAREEIGDFVIVRSEGPPAYNFAVTVDDAQMRITRVLRGDDHISNTPRQILLYSAMGFGLPEFGHLPMILGPDGSRLSKRHGATSVDEFRARGFLPEALINYLALLGWNPGGEREIFTPKELIEIFSLERVNKSAATFSAEKLTWINGQQIRALPPERVFELALPFLQDKGYLPDSLDGKSEEWARRLVALLAGSAATLEDLADQAALFFEFDAAAALADPELSTEINTIDSMAVLEAFVEEAASGPIPDGEAFKELAKAVRAKTGAKGKGLFHPLRIGITGLGSGPDLSEVAPLLDAGAALDLPKPVIGARERVRAIIAKAKEN